MKYNKAQLIDALGSFTHDPLGFVYFAFPWGEKGTPLENFDGPDEWQVKTFKKIGEELRKGKSLAKAIQIAVASGHGIGKSAFSSLLILFAIATHENTRGVVTANTDTQLKSKTWAELNKWYNLFIGKELFTYTATALFSADKQYEKTWRIDAIPWSESNPEAFAGLHNQGNRILIIFDEASAISDKIWEVTEGALTDKETEIIWCVFGNPTRNSGRFRECFRKHRAYWTTYQIDSRTVKISNKAKLQEWVDIHGEDSDFVKVRVRGIFPSASDTQFISASIVDEAQKRMYRVGEFNNLPVIIGVDPAWTGGDTLRAYMWGEMKEWLKEGGSIPNEQGLYDDLVGPEAIIDKNGRIQLESKKDMKERGLPSPNKGDALALTFAFRVTKKINGNHRRVANTEYKPFG